MLKYCLLIFVHFLSCYKFLHLFFVILPVQTFTRFIKLITQCRPYNNFFSKAFSHENIVVVTYLTFFANKGQMHLALNGISQETFQMKNQVVKSCFEVLR